MRGERTVLDGAYSDCDVSSVITASAAAPARILTSRHPPPHLTSPTAVPYEFLSHPRYAGAMS